MRNRDFLCPLSHEYFTHPTIASDGFTYDYHAILKRFQTKNTSPITKEKFSSHDLKTDWHMVAKMRSQGFKLAIVNLAQESTPPFVYLKSLGNSQTVTCVYNSYHTIADYKNFYENATYTPVTQQRFVFAGKVLSNNDNTLADYDIHDSCTIHVIPPLCGD